LIAPVRSGPIFDATVNVTPLFPVPLAPILIVIHESVVTAVHVHSALELTTLNPPVPPAELKLVLVGERE